MNSVAFIIALIALPLLAVDVLPYISWRLRRGRFRARPGRSFDNWFGEFYQDKQCDKEMIRGLYGAIGKDIGVDATQIYPSDRFEVELRCPEWWGPRGSELEGTEVWMEEFLKPYRESIPGGASTSKTVGQLVSELEAIISKANML